MPSMHTSCILVIPFHSHFDIAARCPRGRGAFCPTAVAWACTLQSKVTSTGRHQAQLMPNTRAIVTSVRVFLLLAEAVAAGIQCSGPSDGAATIMARFLYLAIRPPPAFSPMMM